MLDSEVDALLDVPVLDLLVYDNTNCALCNIVDDSSFAMVDLVWHTVDRISICLLTSICPNALRRFVQGQG